MLCMLPCSIQMCYANTHYVFVQYPFCVSLCRESYPDESITSCLQQRKGGGAAASDWQRRLNMDRWRWLDWSGWTPVRDGWWRLDQGQRQWLGREVGRTLGRNDRWRLERASDSCWNGKAVGPDGWRYLVRGWLSRLDQASGGEWDGPVKTAGPHRRDGCGFLGIGWIRLRCQRHFNLGRRCHVIISRMYPNHAGNQTQSRVDDGWSTWITDQSRADYRIDTTCMDVKLNRSPPPPRSPIPCRYVHWGCSKLRPVSLVQYHGSQRSWFVNPRPAGGADSAPLSNIRDNLRTT